nr:hypothetical protein [Nitrosomonas nitrosa]
MDVAIESIVGASSVNDDISIWVLIAHVLASKPGAAKSFDVAKFFLNLQVCEHALWVKCALRQDKEHIVALNGSAAKIILQIPQVGGLVQKCGSRSIHASPLPQTLHWTVRKEPATYMSPFMQ